MEHGNLANRTVPAAAFAAALKWSGVAAATLLAACSAEDLARFDPGKQFSDIANRDFAFTDQTLFASTDYTYSATDLLPSTVIAREAPPDVEAGQGGYRGKIADMASALDVQLREVEDFRLAVRVVGNGNDYRIQGLGSTLILEQDMLWDLQVVTFEDQRRRLNGLRPPLATGRLTSTPQGKLRGLLLAFPAYQRRGVAPPPRDSNEYKTFADSLSYMVATLPQGTVKAGDDLGPPPALARLMATTSTQPLQSTLQTRVVGETMVENRRAIVAVYDGNVAYQQGSDTVTYAIAGHALYDAVTGLLTHSTLRLDRSGNIDGAPLQDRVFIETAASPFG